MTYGRDAELLPGERVSWPASTPELAPITMLSRGILGGDGERPEHCKMLLVVAAITFKF